MTGPAYRRDLPRQVLAAFGIFRTVPADFDDQLHFQISNFQSGFWNLES
jgi:hypothetical protein